MTVRSDKPSPLRLSQSLGFISLTIYGVGNMLGAGIYGLIGKAAGEMGNAIWMAFLASLVAAGLTGLSYASLGSRYPKAAGAAFVLAHAFRRPMLAYVVGLSVMASGLTSMATTTQVFAGYLLPLLKISDTGLHRGLIVTLLVIVLAAINFWGMRQASWLNVICTTIEVGGLLLVVTVGLKYWGRVDYFDSRSVVNPSGELSATLLVSTAILTFYSFIGFEDLLNVSEEVKNPRRTFPLALLSALGIAGLVYFAVCITVVSVLPAHELAASTAPLADVMNTAAPWFNTQLFSVMALFAVVNTALLNYIMGSRIAYGMATQGLLPQFFSRLHATRRTPHAAILILGAIVLGLSGVGGIKDLAKATSILLICSFLLINLALFVLQRRQDEPQGGFEVPGFVPIAGAVVCATMIGSEVVAALRANSPLPLIIAGGIVSLIIALYLILRPTAAAVKERH